jgi:hypothetical protein
VRGLRGNNQVNGPIVQATVLGIGDHINDFGMWGCIGDLFGTGVDGHDSLEVLGEVK